MILVKQKECIIMRILQYLNIILLPNSQIYQICNQWVSQCCEDQKILKMLDSAASSIIDNQFSQKAERMDFQNIEEMVECYEQLTIFLNFFKFIYEPLTKVYKKFQYHELLIDKLYTVFCQQGKLDKEILKFYQQSNLKEDYQYFNKIINFYVEYIQNKNKKDELEYFMTQLELIYQNQLNNLHFNKEDYQQLNNYIEEIENLIDIIVKIFNKKDNINYMNQIQQRLITYINNNIEITQIDNIDLLSQLFLKDKQLFKRYTELIKKIETLTSIQNRKLITSWLKQHILKFKSYMNSINIQQLSLNSIKQYCQNIFDYFNQLDQIYKEIFNEDNQVANTIKHYKEQLFIVSDVDFIYLLQQYFYFLFKSPCYQDSLDAVVFISKYIYNQEQYLQNLKNQIILFVLTSNHLNEQAKSLLKTISMKYDYQEDLSIIIKNLIEPKEKSTENGLKISLRLLDNSPYPNFKEYNTYPLNDTIDSFQKKYYFDNDQKKSQVQIQWLYNFSTVILSYKKKTQVYSTYYQAQILLYLDQSFLKQATFDQILEYFHFDSHFLNKNLKILIEQQLIICEDGQYAINLKIKIKEKKIHIKRVINDRFLLHKCEIHQEEKKEEVQQFKVEAKIIKLLKMCKTIKKLELKKEILASYDITNKTYEEILHKLEKQSYCKFYYDNVLYE